MADKTTQAEPDGPRVVAPSTRVSVAFPFSNIVVNEPGEYVAELAQLVERLAATIAKLHKGEETTRLAKEATQLAERIQRANDQ